MLFRLWGCSRFRVVRRVWQATAPPDHQTRPHSGQHIVHATGPDDEKATMEVGPRSEADTALKMCKASRTGLSQATARIKSKGEHHCLIARHDRAAVFHAEGSDRAVIILMSGLHPDMGWRALTAMHDTHEASKFSRNEVADTKLREGAKQAIVEPMTCSQKFGYVTVCHGDDFSTIAAALDEIDRVLTETFDTKTLPRFGPPAFGGEPTEGQHLGNTIRSTAIGVGSQSETR